MIQSKNFHLLKKISMLGQIFNPNPIRFAFRIFLESGSGSRSELEPDPDPAIKDLTLNFFPFFLIIGRIGIHVGIFAGSSIPYIFSLDQIPSQGEEPDPY